MTASYEYSVPVSRLSAKSELVSSDVLLVSEYNTESDSLYYTDQVAAGRYGEMISCQFGIQGMKEETRDTSVKISAVSSDYVLIRNDTDELSASFLPNDALTRKIPSLSASKDMLSVDALSTLRHERVIDLGMGDLGRFHLSAFSVNLCRPSGASMVKLIVPPQMPGLSRHFTARVSSDVDFVPVFCGAHFFAQTELADVVSAGCEMYYDFKEVRPNGFYVRWGIQPRAYEADPDEAMIIYHAGKDVETIEITFDSNDDLDDETVEITFDSNDDLDDETVEITFDSNDADF